MGTPCTMTKWQRTMILTGTRLCEIMCLSPGPNKVASSHWVLTLCHHLLQVFASWCKFITIKPPNASWCESQYIVFTGMSMWTRLNWTGFFWILCIMRIYLQVCSATHHKSVCVRWHFQICNDLWIHLAKALQYKKTFTSLSWLWLKSWNKEHSY